MVGKAGFEKTSAKNAWRLGDRARLVFAFFLIFMPSLLCESLEQARSSFVVEWNVIRLTHDGVTSSC